jgi:release factor glutamine methyltransferase
MTNIKFALTEAASVLEQTSTTSRLDAEVLLATVINKNRTYLYSHSEDMLSSEEIELFSAMIRKRALGIPVAYITSKKEFWGIEFEVTNTLIPRPETELIVELCLKFYPKDEPIKLLDLGTGSGAIALALAKERNQWVILATDKEERALETANRNAQRLDLTQVSFIRSAWFTQIPLQPFDIIVSNPPYIASNDAHLISEDIRHEPLSALVSENNGYADLYQIIDQSVNYLSDEGILFLEHGYQQKVQVEKRLRQNGFKNIYCWKDFQGNERITCASKKCTKLTY